MKKILMIIVFIISLKLCGQNKDYKIFQSDIICVKKDSIDYINLKCKTDPKINLFLPTELCERVSRKENDTKIKHLENKGIYLELNNSFFSLNFLKKNYLNCFPVSYSVRGNIIIFNLEIISDIGLNGYNYIIFEINNYKTVSYFEIDSKTKTEVYTLLKKFKILKKKKKLLSAEKML